MSCVEVILVVLEIKMFYMMNCAISPEVVENLSFSLVTISWMSLHCDEGMSN